jgi:hypothetical protein
MNSANIPIPGLEPPEGVAEKYLFKIEGPDGPCFIAAAGGMPEREHTYVYQDKDYYFYFYAKSAWEGDIYDIDIENATVAKFTGPTPRVQSNDLPRIANNIRAYFEGRSFIFPSRPRPSGEHFRNLTFSWGVLR